MNSTPTFEGYNEREPFEAEISSLRVNTQNTYPSICFTTNGKFEGPRGVHVEKRVYPTRSFALASQEQTKEEGTEVWAHTRLCVFSPCCISVCLCVSVWVSVYVCVRPGMWNVFTPKWFTFFQRVNQDTTLSHVLICAVTGRMQPPCSGEHLTHI